MSVIDTLRNDKNMMLVSSIPQFVSSKRVHSINVSEELASTFKQTRLSKLQPVRRNPISNVYSNKVAKLANISQ